MCVLYCIRGQTCVLYYYCIYANVEDIWFDGMRCPLFAMKSERLIRDNVFQRNTLLVSKILPFKIASRSDGSSLQNGTILIFPWRTSESTNQSSSGHHSHSVVVVVVAAQQKLEGRPRVGTPVARCCQTPWVTTSLQAGWPTQKPAAV